VEEWLTLIIYAQVNIIGSWNEDYQTPGYSYDIYSQDVEVYRNLFVERDVTSFHYLSSSCSSALSYVDNGFLSCIEMIIVETPSTFAYFLTVIVHRWDLFTL
jgi:hypothetical protein